MYNTKKVLSTFLLLAMVAMLVYVAPVSMAVTHTVTFDGNGNTGGTAPAAATAEEGTDVTLPGAGDLVKDGFVFKGWAEDPAATAAVATYTMGTADATLYAVWEAVPAVTKVKVTFDANEATNGTAPAPVEGQTGDDVALPAVGDLVKDGFEFKGWAEDKAATDALPSYKFPAADVTLFAVWVQATAPAPTEVTLTFSLGSFAADGAKATLPADQKVAIGAEVKFADLPAPTDVDFDGRQFVGWTLNDGETSEAMDETFKPDKDTTLYAAFAEKAGANPNPAPSEPVETTVIFDMNGGEGTQPDNLVDPEAKEGDAITLPQTINFAKEGFKFLGWSLDKAAVAPDATFVYPKPDEEKTTVITLYAVWEKVGGPVLPEPTPGDKPKPIPPKPGKVNDSVLVPVCKDGNTICDPEKGLPETGGVANVMPTLVGEILLIMGSGLAFGRKNK